MLDLVNRGARSLPNAAIYILGAVPFAWLVWMTMTGGLGPDPVRAIEQYAGLWGLQFLVATLSISPVRRLGLNFLRMRRALGLLSFFYILLHFLTWIFLDIGLNGAEIAEALWKRPYILIGFAAFVAMIPLAVTSNNRAIGRMGPKAWARLHKLTYLIAIGGALHYLLLVKIVTLQPVLYAVLVAGLLGMRLFWRARRRALTPATQ